MILGEDFRNPKKEWQSYNGKIVLEKETLNFISAYVPQVGLRKVFKMEILCIGPCEIVQDI